MHDRLTQRFVDKRIVILNKTLKEYNNLEAVVKLDGKVFVEEEQVGTLHGFDFVPSLSQGEKAAPILTAARKILPKEIERRVRELLISDNAAFKFNADSSILWQNNKVASLTYGQNIYSPKIIVNNSELLSDEHIKQIELRIIEAVEKNINDVMSEAINLEKPIQHSVSKLDKSNSDNEVKKDKIDTETGLSGKALGIAYQVYEGMGSAKTSNLSMSINNLSENDKRNLAKLGLRLGVETIYLPNLLKPISISLRALLWSVYNKNFPVVGSPPDGRVSVLIGPDASNEYYRALGFVPLGKLALRADIAERLSALIRVEARTGKFKINDAMLSISGSTKIQMEEVLYDLGYIKAGEEPSTLVDQIPIIIFERNKNQIKNFPKNSNLKQKKIQSLKAKIRKEVQAPKKEKLPDPLSPFAILKSIKIK